MCSPRCLARPGRFSHRPIPDLLPGLLYCGRQLVHVLQEQRKRPYLLIAERVPERRHARQTNTMLDLSERVAFRVALYPIGRQLRRLLIKPADCLISRDRHP